MILEIADIRIHTGQNAAFEAAIAHGASEVIAHAKGFEIADHALSLYAHCKRSPCPYKSA